MALTDYELLDRAYKWWSETHPHDDECMIVRKQFRWVREQDQPDADTMNAVHRVLSDYATTFPEESPRIKLVLEAWEQLFLGFETMQQI